MFTCASGCRAAFAEFDAELVSKYTEKKQMVSISAAYGLDLGRVRGVVDNAKRILEVHDPSYHAQIFVLFHQDFMGLSEYKKMVDEAKNLGRMKWTVDPGLSS